MADGPGTRFTLADYYDRRTYFADARAGASRSPSPSQMSSSSRSRSPSPPAGRGEYAPRARDALRVPVPVPAPAAYADRPPLVSRDSGRPLVRGASELSLAEPAIPLTSIEPHRSLVTPDGKRDDDEKVSAYGVYEARSAPSPGSFVKRLVPSSWSSRLLVAVVLFETVIDIAIEADILWRFRQEVTSGDSTALELENKRRLPVYLCVFGLAHLWQLVLTIDAIRTKNTIQVIGVAIFNGMFLVYAAIQVTEIREILGSATSADTSVSLLTLPLNVLTYVVIGVIAACEVAVGVLAWFVYRDFGWKIYRFLGADLSIKRCYFQYQIFDCICRFSAFFFAGFGIQFIFLVLNKADPEYIITWVMLPLSLVFLIMGILAARYEKRYLMAVFSAGLVAGCAYFTFKLVRIWQQSTTTYAHLATSLTVFSALSIVCLVLCFAWGLVVWRNFGAGLRAHIVGRRGPAQLGSAVDLEAMPRISID